MRDDDDTEDTEDTGARAAVVLGAMGVARGKEEVGSK